MVEKINGRGSPGEFLGKQLDFYALSSTADIRPLSNGGSIQSQFRFDKLLEVIGQRGQPILLGGVSGTTSPYIMRFALEHPGAWNSNGLANFQSAADANVNLRDAVAAALVGTFVAHSMNASGAVVSVTGTYGANVSTGMAVTVSALSDLLPHPGA